MTTFCPMPLKILLENKKSITTFILFHIKNVFWPSNNVTDYVLLWDKYIFTLNCSDTNESSFTLVV